MRRPQIWIPEIEYYQKMGGMRANTETSRSSARARAATTMSIIPVSKSEVCAQEFCAAMHIKTPFDNAQLPVIQSMHVRLFFGSISKTHKI